MNDGSGENARLLCIDYNDCGGVVEQEKREEKQNKVGALLEEKGETAKDAGGNGKDTVGLAELESSSGAALGGGAGGGSGTAEARVDGLAGRVGGLATVGAGLGGGGRRSGGDVDAGGVLGAARVVGTAVIFALSVSSAVCYALGAPFRADVVGECLRVLGGVGADVVVADAGVGEGVWVAVILWNVSFGLRKGKDWGGLDTSMVLDEFAAVWRQIRGQAYCWLLHQVSA